jgi:hypothetical protein
MGVHNRGSTVWIRLQTVPFSTMASEMSVAGTCAPASAARDAQTAWPRGDIDTLMPGQIPPTIAKADGMHCRVKGSATASYCAACPPSMTAARSRFMPPCCGWTAVFGKPTCRFVK